SELVANDLENFFGANIAVCENPIIVAIAKNAEILRISQFATDQFIDVAEYKLRDEIHQNGSLGDTVSLPVASCTYAAVDLVSKQATLTLGFLCYFQSVKRPRNAV